MVDWKGGFGRRVARETLHAAATWVAATTALFVGFRLILGHYLLPYGMSLKLEADPARERLPVGDAPLPFQWLEWLWRFATFQFGRSPLDDEPVLSVFLDGLGESLFLVTIVLVVGAVGTFAVATLVPALDGRVEHAAFAAVTYGVQVVAPVTSLGVLYLLEVHGVFPFPLIGNIYVIPDRYPITVALVGALVAAPMVGHAARRVQRVARSDRGRGDGPVDLLARAFRPLDAWVYLTYTVSSLVVVERTLPYRGFGSYVAGAVKGSDAPMLLGLLGGLVWCLVVLRYAANLWTAVRDHRRGGRPGSTDGRAADTPDGEEPGPTAATVARTVLTRPKVLAGAGLLGVIAVVSFAGSFLTTPEVAPVWAPGVYGYDDGVGPRLVLHNLASLVAVAGTAVVVALLVGASTALVAAYLASTAGWPRRAARGLAVPADAALLLPVGIVLGFAVVRAGPHTPRPVEELELGVAGGLVLAGYVFHAVHGVARSQFDAGRDPAGAAAESLVAGVARVDAVVVWLLFSVAGWAFLDPMDRIADVSKDALSLGQAFENLGTWVVFESVPDPNWLLEALVLQAALVLALPVLGVVLLADGLAEAALQLRTAESDEFERRPSSTDENVATSAPESGDAS